MSDAALVVRDGRISWIGSVSHVPASQRAGIQEEIDITGGLVTAGLVDAHTHPVYLVPRSAEIAARSAGLSYADLEGGAGIGATVAATRAAREASLERAVRGRLRAFLRAGATTVEAKTGYHLAREGEIGAVRLLRRIGKEPGMPRLHVTFMPAHALPPEAAGDADAYIDEAGSWSDEARRAGADACDVFCDEGYFTVEQARRILQAGASARLQGRIHADELAWTGGAKLAAEAGAASADHLLHLRPEDARALASAGVTATLCPATALSLGRRPDIASLRDAGVEIALGTDHNPGTSGITSLSLVVALAIWALGLSVDDALRAATVGGAASLRRDDIGVIAPGARADIVAWDSDHEGDFAWAWGLTPVAVWLGGDRVV